MKIYNLKELSKDKVYNLCSRSLQDDSAIESRVNEILSRVKSEGDRALLSYSKSLDQVALERLYLDTAELKSLATTLPDAGKKAIQQAYENIKKFHSAQQIQESAVETMPGVNCWRESRAIEKVGLYIPGGTAVLPSTFLMLATPARLAGCKEIVVCSPAQKDGKTNAYLAYCALLLGIERLYLVGGAQAIAAMAYGTESIPQVYKIFGPGNRYVTMAKTLLQKQVAIDMPAGPSEVLILADESANPEYLAADLLAQAEHGPDSQSILVCSNETIINQTLSAIERQLKAIPRHEIAKQALNNSYILKVDDMETGMEFSNLYAPEHLIIASNKATELIPLICNAGSVFIGHNSPESAGDYASGTNHTLPTSGYAKAYSGVSYDAFIKKISFQQISPIGLQNLADTVMQLAEAEGLIAHKNAISIRLKS